MKIQSARLEMRSYRDEDFDFLYSLLADPEIVQFIGNGKTRNREEALQFMYWIYRCYRENPELGLRVLIRKEDGATVGHAGLVPQKVEGKEELEIGYWVAKDYWGQGYATEAAKALRYYGSQYLGRKRFVSLIQPGNGASRKVAERLGMQLEKKITMADKEVCLYSVVD